MSTPNFGANKFTFAGDRTQITYYPTSTGPGPIRPGQEPGRLEYRGIEGDLTFSGQNIELQEGPLGTLVTIILQPNPDIGVGTCTLLVPQVFGVSRDQPLTFETLAIKTTRRGFSAEAGAGRTYTILPLLGKAEDVILPL
jgi:hypothetical protein